MSNYAKLKTNLKLAIQRLKLLEKKKSKLLFLWLVLHLPQTSSDLITRTFISFPAELSLKSRKEIADYIAANKADRARIRVEHIIREDNFVEAMEMLVQLIQFTIWILPVKWRGFLLFWEIFFWIFRLEMFIDLLLARFGLIEKMK